MTLSESGDKFSEDKRSTSFEDMGDFAALDLSERGMIAGDMIDYLPDAFAMVG